MKLLLSQDRLNHVLAMTSREGIEKDIQDLQKKVSVSPPTSALTRSLNSSLEIQKRRLENLDKANQNIQIVEAELDRIEKQVALLGEESQIGTDPTAFTERLDTVTTSLQEANKWITENAEILGAISEEPVHKALSQS